MPLVINSIGSGHTDMQTQMHTYVHTETILRNQAYAGCRPALAWFKDLR